MGNGKSDEPMESVNSMRELLEDHRQMYAIKCLEKIALKAELASQAEAHKAEVERLKGHLSDCCINETCGHEENLTTGDAVAMTMNGMKKATVNKLTTDEYVDLSDVIHDLSCRAIHAAIKDREAELTSLRGENERLRPKTTFLCKEENRHLECSAIVQGAQGAGDWDKCACPCHSKVVEDLRARLEEVEKERDEYSSIIIEANTTENVLRQQLDSWVIETAKRANERDAAKIAGMEHVLSLVARFEVPGDQIFDAIQSLIDQARAGK